MKKQLKYKGGVIVILTILGMAPYAVSAGSNMEAPDKAITIEGKKPATFKHDTHIGLGLDCGVCHHNKEHQPLSAEAMGKIDDRSKLQCITCHNSDFKNPELQKRKDVFHARCKECHKKGVDGKKGPTGCNSCHIKKKKKAIEGC